MLDTTEGGLLKSVEQLLSEIFIPTLRKMNHGWGELDSPQAQSVKQDFISSLESFVSVLAGAQESLQEKVSSSRHCCTSRISLVLNCNWLSEPKAVFKHKLI